MHDNQEIQQVDQFIIYLYIIIQYNQPYTTNSISNNLKKKMY